VSSEPEENASASVGAPPPSVLDDVPFELQTLGGRTDAGERKTSKTRRPLPRALPPYRRPLRLGRASPGSSRETRRGRGRAGPRSPRISSGRSRVPFETIVGSPGNDCCVQRGPPCPVAVTGVGNRGGEAINSGACAAVSGGRAVATKVSTTESGRVADGRRNKARVADSRPVFAVRRSRTSVVGDLPSRGKVVHSGEMLRDGECVHPPPYPPPHPRATQASRTNRSEALPGQASAGNRPGASRRRCRPTSLGPLRGAWLGSGRCRKPAFRAAVAGDRLSRAFGQAVREDGRELVFRPAPPVVRMTLRGTASRGWLRPAAIRQPARRLRSGGDELRGAPLGPCVGGGARSTTLGHDFFRTGCPVPRASEPIPPVRVRTIRRVTSSGQGGNGHARALSAKQPARQRAAGPACPRRAPSRLSDHGGRRGAGNRRKREADFKDAAPAPGRPPEKLRRVPASP